MEKWVYLEQHLIPERLPDPPPCPRARSHHLPSQDVGVHHGDAEQLGEHAPHRRLPRRHSAGQPNQEHDGESAGEETKVIESRKQDLVCLG